MEKIEFEKLKHKNCAFTTAIPWHVMGNLFSKESSEYEKGLGIFDLEKIISSILLYDKIVINTYPMLEDGVSVGFDDPLSKILIEEGVIGVLGDDFIDRTDFIEIAIKDGNYAGLCINEILDILGENSLREFVVSKMIQFAIRDIDDLNIDLEKAFDIFDIYIKKIKFLNHLGADYNIPLVTSAFEDDLLKTDQNLGTLLLKEFIEKKYNSHDFLELSNKIKEVKVIRLATEVNINFPPLLTEVVKNSNGNINKFPTEIIKLRNKIEFQKIRELLKEVKLEPYELTAEQISMKFMKIMNWNKQKKQILEKVISIPVSFIPAGNESIEVIKTILNGRIQDLSSSSIRKFNLKKSFNIKSNSVEANLLVKNLLNDQLLKKIEKNRVDFNQRNKAFHKI